LIKSCASGLIARFFNVKSPIDCFVLPGYRRVLGSVSACRRTAHQNFISSAVKCDFGGKLVVSAEHGFWLNL
jgi:hypothetical protein